MFKEFIYIVILSALGSILLRILLQNAPITATWLQDITVYNK